MIMIEIAFGIFLSSFLSVIFIEVKELKEQVNKVENELISISYRFPKRKDDIDIEGQW